MNDLKDVKNMSQISETASLICIQAIQSCIIHSEACAY